jgi:hypothetical protein
VAVRLLCPLVFTPSRWLRAFLHILTPVAVGYIAWCNPRLVLWIIRRELSLLQHQPFCFFSLSSNFHQFNRLADV